MFVPATARPCHGHVRAWLAIALLAVSGACATHQRLATSPAGHLAAFVGSPIALRVDAYHVRLAIDPKATGFDGELELRATIQGGGDTIQLHARELELFQATLTDGVQAWALTPLTVAKEPVTAPAMAEAMLRLRLPAAAAPPRIGQAVVIRLVYRGALRDDDGLFARRLGNDAYVFSDLEPRAARRVMPLVDEPSVKVPWTVELDVPAGMPAYANAPQRSRTRLPSGRDRVAFEPTAPLPSYLFAIAVGPLVEVPVPNAPRPTRFLLPASHVHHAAAAVAVLPNIMRAAEQFVGLPLPYPKHDFVGIPDFDGSAMEHPGLITFDLAALGPTRDGKAPPRTPISQQLAIILAHEVAHLWFGDLVTPTTWRDLWFNEGFATYVSYRVLDDVFPTWALGRDELAERQAPATIDQLIGAQPVRPASVATPELLFTPMTYLKGGAIIETLAATVGHAPFMAAMREVLLAHAHGNVPGETVMHAMARALPPALGDEAARLAMVTELFERSGLTEISISTKCTADDQVVVIEPIRQVVARFPLCLRLGDAAGSSRICVALGRPVEIKTQGCARYALPAGGEGYVKFTLSPSLRRTTLQALPELTPRERFVVTGN